MSNNAELNFVNSDYTTLGHSTNRDRPMNELFCSKQLYANEQHTVGKTGVKCHPIKIDNAEGRHKRYDACSVMTSIGQWVNEYSHSLSLSGLWSTAATR